MKAGDTVRHCGRTIETKRRRWLAAGRASEKSAARQWLDDAIAWRGEVVEMRPSARYGETAVVRDLETGATQDALSYMFEVCAK
jgi:hypothetical protein